MKQMIIPGAFFVAILLLFGCAASENTVSDDDNRDGASTTKDGSSSGGGGTPSVSCKFNSDCPEGQICNDDYRCVNYQKPDATNDDDDNGISDTDDNDNNNSGTLLDPPIHSSIDGQYEIEEIDIEITSHPADPNTKCFDIEGPKTSHGYSMDDEFISYATDRNGIWEVLIIHIETGKGFIFKKESENLIDPVINYPYLVYRKRNINEETRFVYLSNLANGKTSLVKQLSYYSYIIGNEQPYIYWHDLNADGTYTEAYLAQIGDNDETTILWQKSQVFISDVSSKYLAVRGVYYDPIHFYDLETFSEIPLSGTMVSYKQSPNVTDRYAVYLDCRDGKASMDQCIPNWQIYGYDFEKSQEFPILSGEHHPRGLDVDGVLVVWNENIYEIRENIRMPVTEKLVAYNIETQTHSTIIAANTFNSLPKIRKKWIGWRYNALEKGYGYCVMERAKVEELVK